MEQKFEQVAEHLYKRQYQITGGGWKTIYYARFVCRRKGKRRHFSLGSDLRTAKDELMVLEARNVRRDDFDADKAPRDPERMTVEKWSRIYKDLEEIKAKRSFSRDCQHIARLNLFFGATLLTEVKREHLFQYRKQRLEEHIVRNGRPSRTKVSMGTLANELSCLRHMLKVAARENVDVSLPSFDDLIVRNPGRERVLDAEEERALLEAYPLWLKRVCIVARETCLSQGDIIRLTREMIDRKSRVIVPEGGRVKTGVKQTAPLTNVVLQVLDEIEKDKKRGAMVPNIEGLVFTRADGRAIDKDMITGAIKRAREKTGVKDFRFHDYRHSAKTSWSRRNIHVDIAMLAAGHSSVQMHKRYVNLKGSDVAEAFGLSHSGLKKDVAS